jgi:hypothetical protein
MQLLRILYVDGELLASLVGPGRAVARQPHDNAGQSPELLGERDRPRSRRVRALQNPCVGVAKAS